MKNRSHKRVGPQEKTWLGNLKASDLEKHVSSRSWLVHQLHLEFWEHFDFETNSPQLIRMGLLLVEKGFLDEPSSATAIWQTRRETKRMKKSGLELEIENSMDEWFRAQRFQVWKIGKLSNFIIILCLFLYSFYFTLFETFEMWTLGHKRLLETALSFLWRFRCCWALGAGNLLRYVCRF